MEQKQAVDDITDRIDELEKCFSFIQATVGSSDKDLDNKCSGKKQFQ